MLSVVSSNGIDEVKYKSTIKSIFLYNIDLNLRGKRRKKVVKHI